MENDMKIVMTTLEFVNQGKITPFFAVANT
jgi:hypothetical protein